MFLYIGQETVIPAGDVIGIFDLETTTAPRDGRTRDFLARAEKRGGVRAVSALLPKSFLVCADGTGRETVLLSHLSPSTLRRRVENPLNGLEPEEP